MASPLISATALIRLLESPSGRPTVLDVRWDLASGARRDLYREAHVPDAGFIDLDTELAAPGGRGGRHPLPEASAFGASMGRAGVSLGVPVVVYDAGPATAAARAWWLLRYFGHPAVAVLDGGLAAWSEAGGRLEAGDAEHSTGDFIATPGGMPVLNAAAAAALPERGVLLDARSTERFRGETAPVDAVAGHIPGARNHPTTLNVEASGRFRDPAELQRAFAAAGIGSKTELGAYCGSGVTAAHEILALELAGYQAALYPGSWSEWIADPSRPVATGER